MIRGNGRYPLIELRSKLTIIAFGGDNLIGGRSGTATINFASRCKSFWYQEKTPYDTDVLVLCKITQ